MNENIKLFKGLDEYEATYVGIDNKNILINKSLFKIIGESYPYYNLNTKNSSI